MGGGPQFSSPAFNLSHGWLDHRPSGGIRFLLDVWMETRQLRPRDKKLDHVNTDAHTLAREHNLQLSLP